jgi:pimeloyl-ACP methyl ester carboxylesterase
MNKNGRLNQHALRAAILVIGVSLLSACANNAVYSTGHAAIGDAQIAYSKTGMGTPSIVLQAGLSTDKNTWATIVNALEKQHVVFAYDRPGYGDSKEIIGTRDPCTIATELRNTLRQTGVNPPYLLVGHAIGGLYQYVFAKMYPHDVAGVLLLDPSHPRKWEAIQEQSTAISASLKTLHLVSFSSTEKREFAELTNCLENIDFKTPLSMPSRVLFRTVYSRMETGTFEKISKSLENDWHIFTGAPSLQYIQGAAHFIHQDRPQEAINAISSLRDEIKKGENKAQR